MKGRLTRPISRCCCSLPARRLRRGRRRFVGAAGPDPATVTPADAPLFAEGVVRPEGDRKEALDSALSKLLATDDPGAFIVEQLDKALAAATRASPTRTTSSRGSASGQASSSRPSRRTQGAVVIATTDPPAAQEAIDKAAAADEQPERRRSYRVSITCVDRDGTPPAWSATSSSPGPRTPSATRWTPPRAVAGGIRRIQRRSWTGTRGPGGLRLRGAEGDPRRARKSGLVTLGRGRRPRAPCSRALLGAAGRRVGLGGLGPARASGVGGGRRRPGLAESPLLRDFPEERGSRSRSPTPARPTGACSTRSGRRGVRRSELDGGLGFDLADQVTRWAGDLGGFVAGTSLFGLGGALVVETNDQDASARTLDQLRRALGSEPGLSVEPLTDTRRSGVFPQPRRPPDLLPGRPARRQGGRRARRLGRGRPLAELHAGGLGCLQLGRRRARRGFRPGCLRRLRALAPARRELPAGQRRSRLPQREAATSTTSTTSCSAVAVMETGPSSRWCSACAMRRRETGGESGTAAAVVGR